MVRGSAAERISTTMKTKAAATRTAETAAVAEQGATPAPQQAASKKKASKKAAKPAAKGASTKAAKPAAQRTAKAPGGQPREGSKKQVVLDLLRRKEGATMDEIAKATDWQKHSIRGFISGQLTKKMGLTVDSSKNAAGERTYRIAAC